MSFPIHPIMEQSFALIDQEIGEHNFSPAEYAIVRRVIHSTADFEFKHLIRFSSEQLRRELPPVPLRTHCHGRGHGQTGCSWVGGTNFWQPGD